MIEFPYDREKTIASLLYICNHFGDKCDKYQLLKILYFAEQKHLVEWGRPITGDNMIAMKLGAVPSHAYDELKKTHSQYFDILDERTIKAKSKPNLEVLSESDIECLNESIEENKSFSFSGIKKKAHSDKAYNWTIKNLGEKGIIPIEEIAKSGGASNEMIEYIELVSENYNLCLDV